MTGPSPVDRGRTGSKHHLITDPSELPLAISLTGGDRNDVTQLLPLVDGVGPVRGKVGRPRLRAESLSADRSYDHDKHAASCGAAVSSPSSLAAPPNTARSPALGAVERTFGWLHFFRRLRLRWKRRPELHEAFVHLGRTLICQRYLRTFSRHAILVTGG